jgi:hypothetical protein
MVMPLPCIQEVPDLNLGQGTKYSDMIILSLSRQMPEMYVHATSVSFHIISNTLFTII